MLHTLVGLLLVSHPLAFADALARADAAPSVVAEAEAARARGEHARKISHLTANPVLSLQPGARAMNSGGSGAEMYLGLSQRFNLGGLAHKRKETVRLELAQDAAALSEARRSVRRAIAEAWLLCWRAQGELRAAERENELAREFVTQVETLLGAGEATQVDLASARAWQAEAALARLAAEGTGFHAGVELSRAMGGDAEEPEVVSDELPSIDLPDEAGALSLASGGRASR
jgi:outer membrane protein TolC